MMDSYAPIALFTYNRLWHTQQTVESLLKNSEASDSNLIIFSDGAKDKASKAKVAEVRQYLRTIKGFKSIHIIEREENFGLAQSIISGVTDVVNEYGRIIILEDDLITSQYFLKYMNDALDMYEHDDRVISIHGYCYPIEGMPETFFLKGADCWGWATWREQWGLFEKDGEKLLQNLKERKLLDRFDFFGGYRYSRMLKKQIAGEIDSWAVRWYAAALLLDKLTLYPGESLVHNTGNDASGRHCATRDVFDTVLSSNPVRVGSIAVEEHQEALVQFSHFLKQARFGIISSLIGRIKQLKRMAIR